MAAIPSWVVTHIQLSKRKENEMTHAIELEAVVLCFCAALLVLAGLWHWIAGHGRYEGDDRWTTGTACTALGIANLLIAGLFLWNPGASEFQVIPCILGLLAALGAVVLLIKGLLMLIGNKTIF